jgi:hypothetical protein
MRTPGAARRSATSGRRAEMRAFASASRATRMDAIRSTRRRAGPAVSRAWHGICCADGNVLDSAPRAASHCEPVGTDAAAGTLRSSAARSALFPPWRPPRRGAGEAPLMRPGFRGPTELGAAVFLLGARAAVACPVCHTEIGSQVRAGIVGADPGIALLAIGGPFCVAASVLIGLREWLRYRGRSSS